MSDDGITFEHALAAGAGAYLAYKGFQGVQWLANNLTPEATAEIEFLMETHSFRNTDIEKFDALVLSRLPKPITILAPLPAWLTAAEKSRLFQKVWSESWLAAKAEWKMQNPPWPSYARAFLDGIVADLIENVEVQLSVDSTLRKLNELSEQTPLRRLEVVRFIRERILHRSSTEVIFDLICERPDLDSLAKLQHSAEWVDRYKAALRQVPEFSSLARKKGGRKIRSGKGLPRRIEMESSVKLLTSAMASVETALRNKKRRALGRDHGSKNRRTRLIEQLYDDARRSGRNDVSARAVAADKLPLNKGLGSGGALRRNIRAVDYVVRKHRNNGDWDYGSSPGNSEKQV